MPFDLSSLYGGMQDPRMAALMQNRMQGQATGQDMSWMDQPGALQMAPNPYMNKINQMRQGAPMPPEVGAGMPMSPMPEFSRTMDYHPSPGPPPGMQMPPRMPMPQRPMPPLQSLRPQGPPPGQGGMMPPQAQRPTPRPMMGFGGGAASQRSMPQRRRPMPTQAPSPATQGPPQFSL